MVMFNDADVSLTIVDHNIQRLTRAKEKIHDDRAHPPPWIELLSAHYVNVSCVAINLAARAASLHVPGESRLAEPAHIVGAQLKSGSFQSLRTAPFRARQKS
jgi:hypothetical protein